MFASRLLDILQTVPSDVEYETCVFDLAEEDMTMNETKKDNTPPPLEVQGNDESWEAVLVNDLDNENRARDSPRNEEQSGISLHISPTDTNPFTDKNVLECELPELVVCYKEIDYHTVKDICVDEGMPVKDDILIENHEDDASKKDDDDKLVAQEKTKSPPDDSLDKGSGENCVLEGGINSSEEGSFVDKTLPIQEFGTRSFLRSFMGSLDDEENKVVQLPNQIHSGKEVSNGPDSTPIKPELKGAVHAGSLLYNSKVESERITFNFSGPEKVKEQPVDSGDIHEQPLVIEDGKSDDSSANSQVQPGNSKNRSEEDVHEQQSVTSRNYDEQAFDGESSFAVGGVTYSGPISLGSVSLRSEGSTASARSFAFPVLQNEWNSSPIRMRKADRRLKHKGWRSGLLCCRF